MLDRRAYLDYLIFILETGGLDLAEKEDLQKRYRTLEADNAKFILGVLFFGTVEIFIIAIVASFKTSDAVGFVLVEFVALVGVGVVTLLMWYILELRRDCVLRMRDIEFRISRGVTGD